MTVVAQEVKCGAWCIHNVLDKRECDEIVEAALEAGVEHKVARGDRRHRNHQAHYFQDKALSEKLWQRLETVVPPSYTFVSESPPPPGFEEESIQDMMGHWHACGVHSQFTLLYYRSGGHFGPHRDGYKVLSDHVRSILTVAIYLNDRPPGHGGATQFLRDNDDMSIPELDDCGRILSRPDQVEARVEADQAGKAVLFQHDLLHQGEPIQICSNHSNDTIRTGEHEGDLSSQQEEDAAAVKWLLLTQVLYQRDPATAPQWTPDQYEARRILALAEQAEVQGDIPGAIRLYNQAYRLDQTLETNH